MRHVLVIGIAGLFVGGGWTADAAAQRPSGTAVLTGTVRDADGGGAVPRAQVCATLSSGAHLAWWHCAPVDSAAAFRIDSLPAGTWKVEVVCSTIGPFALTLATDEVAVSEAGPARRDWSVEPMAECDRRPLRRFSGEFRGYYTPGFESSEFVPCVEDAWFLPSDALRMSPYDQRRAWVKLSDVRLPAEFRLPDAPRDEYGNPRYFVRWRGTIEGPGHYGHLGVSAFELRVDTIIEIHAPRKGDCPPLHDRRASTRGRGRALLGGWSRLTDKPAPRQ